MKRKIKIGLLGENPTDTNAISKLLSQKKEYQHCVFKSAFKNLTGSGIMTEKGLKMIKELWITKEYEFLIVIRDLDGFEDDKNKRTLLQSRFEEIQKAYPMGNLFLLNIQELEALILADIKSVHSKLSFSGDPMRIVSPKEFIQNELRKIKSKKSYKPTDAPSVFESLDFDTVRKNCRYFDEFIVEFERKIK